MGNCLLEAFLTVVLLLHKDWKNIIVSYKNEKKNWLRTKQSLTNIRTKDDTGGNPIKEI